jgi:hypothetical protein
VRTLRRTFPPRLALLAFLVLAHAARAAGVSVRWNTCYGDGGVQNKNFACNTNAGVEALVGSFTLGADLSQVISNEVVIDLASASSTLPAWWQLRNVDACRFGTPIANLVAPGACVDWANGAAFGGIGAYLIGAHGPNTGRMKLATGLSFTDPKNLGAGQEYFSFMLSISHRNTVGSGSCSGCPTPVCLVLNSVKVVTAVAVNDVTLSGPSYGNDSDWATWQGGAGVTVGGSSGCPAATPALQRTWGAVKALYR